MGTTRCCVHTEERHPTGRTPPLAAPHSSRRGYSQVPGLSPAERHRRHQAGMCPVRARAPTPRPHRLLVYPRFPNDPRCLAPVPLFERSEGTAALATELTKQRAHGKWVLDRCSYYDANLGGVRGARVSQMRARAPPVMRAACLVLLAARSGRKRDLCPRFVKTCFVLHLYTKFARGGDARFMAARNERLQERTVLP